MKLDIQARQFALTEALRGAIQRGLAPLQRRFGDRLGLVQVRIEDVNGEKGGEDKRCQIVVNTGRRKTIVAQALSEDMYQAISLATRRVQQAMRSRLDRRDRRPRLTTPLDDPQLVLGAPQR